MRCNFIKLMLAACLIASATNLHADEVLYFPGASLDERTMKAQVRAEELYQRGEYKRALLIYEKDLAPIGDKYAQYMVGYMHLAGEGTPADRPTALAWYRLAAERRDLPIVQERDALYHTMPQAEVVRSNQIFVDLWRRLGDNQLILRLIRDDMKIVRVRTGSRIPSSNSAPIMIIDPRTGASNSDTYYDNINRRIELRLNFLKSNVEIVDLELGDELAVKKSLEQEMRAEMAALDM